MGDAAIEPLPLELSRQVCLVCGWGGGQRDGRSQGGVAQWSGAIVPQTFESSVPVAEWTYPAKMAKIARCLWQFHIISVGPWGRIVKDKQWVEKQYAGGSVNRLVKTPVGPTEVHQWPIVPNEICDHLVSESEHRIVGIDSSLDFSLLLIGGQPAQVGKGAMC